MERTSRSSRTLVRSVLPATPGIALVVLALLADNIGLGVPGSGFGTAQRVALVCGLLLALVGGPLVRRKAIRRKALALAMGSLVALVLLEICLRIHNPLGARIRGDRIELPRFEKVAIHNDRIPQLDRIIVQNRNELGFRGPAAPRPFADYVTIVAVGGSTTECTYLSDGKTWPDCLGRLLRRRCGTDRIWVNNAGLDGHSTFGHIVLMRDYVARLRPDYVLLLVGANDVGRGDLNFYDRSATALSPLKRLRLLLSHIETWVLAENAWRIWRAHEKGVAHKPFRVAELPTLDSSDAALAQASDEHQPCLDGFRRRLATLVAECRKDAIEPILVTQPCLWGEAIDPATGVDLSRVEVPGTGACSETTWKILEMYNDTTREVSRHEGVLMVDLARTMPKDSTFFYDGLHFTNQGAQKVGEIIGEALWPIVQKRVPERGSPSASRT